MPAAVSGANDGPGEFTFRLLDAHHYGPDPHNGHKVRVSGYLVRLGAEIRVNVQIAPDGRRSCGK